MPDEQDSDGDLEFEDMELPTANASIPHDPHYPEPPTAFDRVVLIDSTIIPTREFPQWGSPYSCYGTIDIIATGISHVLWDNGAGLWFSNSTLRRVGRLSEMMALAHMKCITEAFANANPSQPFTPEPEEPHPAEGYKYRLEFPGWRIVELDEVIQKGDLWRPVSIDGPPRPFFGGSMDTIIGSTFKKYLTTCAASLWVEGGCVYRKHYTRQRLPLNPFYSKPLPLP